MSCIMFYLVIYRLDNVSLETVYHFYGNMFLFLAVALTLTLLGGGIITILSRLFIHSATCDSENALPI